MHGLQFLSSYHARADGSIIFSSSSVLTIMLFSVPSSHYKRPLPCRSSDFCSTLSCTEPLAFPCDRKTWISSDCLLFVSSFSGELGGVNAWAQVNQPLLPYIRKSIRQRSGNTEIRKQNIGLKKGRLFCTILFQLVLNKRHFKRNSKN